MNLSLYIPKHKVITSPKLTKYLNNMETDYDIGVKQNLNLIVKRADSDAIDFDENDKYMQKMNKQGMHTAILIGAPKRIYLKQLSPSEMSQSIDNINQYFEDDTFIKSHEYNELHKMIPNSEYNASRPITKQYTTCGIAKTDIPVSLCETDSNQANHIISNTGVQLGHDAHISFVYHSEDVNSGIPIDIPMLDNPAQSK